MKSFKLLYNELGIKVYYTTSWLRIQKRYKLVEGIDFILVDNDILLDYNVFEHIKNTYSKSKKLKEHSYLIEEQIQEHRNDLDFIEEKLEDNKLKLKIKELTKRLIYKLYKKEYLLNNIKENNIIEQPIQDMIEEDKKTNKIKELNKDNKLLKTEVIKMNEVISNMYGSMLSQNEINKLNNTDYTINKKYNNHITPVFVYADLHYSQVIKKSHVYGYNEYNSDICERRVIDCTKQFIDHYTNDIKTYKDRIIIAVLSDSINNEHHDSDNDKSIPEQIIGVSKLYIKCFNMIKNAFPNTKIDVIFTSSNHDRINMQYSKTPIKDCITNSYTYLIMNNIINAGYTIKWEDEGDWLENIYGNNVLFTHGHNFKINTKNHNSIINQLNKMNKQFMSCDKNGISLICCAHYHADVLTDKFIISCSPVGADPYAKSLGLPFYKPGLTSFAYNSNGEFCNYIVFRSNV